MIRERIRTTVSGWLMLPLLVGAMIAGLALLIQGGHDRRTP